ncbi:TPA: hypothetical protein N0F65_001506 [Lagenidium giganteum]|uniref:UDENN domain-containing protein n=1 Tax=Lagenidium giganteum TaxID=4803 RepID=A0AAV2YZ69_9STRA|nr:TPA: hypothetical protein N0F65_001506 [Lagenidium giganteum]
MSEGEEDTNHRQKSLFAGMGRVRHINNHFREKWGARTRQTAQSSRSSENDTSVRKPRKSSSSHTSPRNRDGGGVSRDDSAGVHRHNGPRSRAAAVDAERYRVLQQWLHDNGIHLGDDLPPRNAHDPELFDKMLQSIERIERTVERELMEMQSLTANGGEARCTEVIEAAAGTLLCDYVVVLGPDVADLAVLLTRDESPVNVEPVVAFAFPPHCQFSAIGIEHFCFPSGVVSERCRENKATQLPGDDFFILLLSGGGQLGQDVQYAFCFKRRVQVANVSTANAMVTTPLCFCVVSRFPFVDFFRRTLELFFVALELDEQTQEGIRASIVSNEFVAFLQTAVEKLNASPFPSHDETRDIVLRPNLPVLQLTESATAPTDPSMQLIKWALPQLLQFLAVDTVLQIVSSMLMEMKVIFLCERLSLLSAATMGITALLHPLEWAGPLITVLPPTMAEYTEAPVPIICGIDKLPLSFTHAPGTIVVDILANTVMIHEDDKDVSFGVLFGSDSLLSNDLEALRTQIRDNLTDATCPVVSFAIRIQSRICELLDHASEAPSPRRQVDPLLRGLANTQMAQKYIDDKRRQREGPGEVVFDMEPPATTQPAGSDELTSNNNIVQLDWMGNCMALFHLALTGHSLEIPIGPVEPTKPDPEEEPVAIRGQLSRSNSHRSDRLVDVDLVEPLNTLGMDEEATPVAETLPRSNEPDAFQDCIPVDAELAQHDDLWGNVLKVEEVPGDPAVSELKTRKSWRDQLITIRASAHEAELTAQNNFAEVSAPADDSVALQPGKMAENEAARKIQVLWQNWLVRQRNSVNELGRKYPHHLVLAQQVPTWKLSKRGFWYECSLFLDRDENYLGWESDARRKHVMSLVEVSTIVDLSDYGIHHDATLLRQVDIQTLSASISFRYISSEQHAAFVRLLSGLVLDGNSAMSQVGDKTEFSDCVEGGVDDDGRNQSQLSMLDQQIDLTIATPFELETFKQRLRSGFVVEKHGRKGKPHAKILFCNADCTRLMWRKAFGRRESLLGSKSLARKSVAITSIVEIVRGKHTPVFLRPAAQASDENQCLSIISRDRTLDIRVEAADDIALLQYGLEALVHQLRFESFEVDPVSLPSRSDNSARAQSDNLSER